MRLDNGLKAGGLCGKFGTCENKGPIHKTKYGQHDYRQPDAAGNGQHTAQEARAAVEHGGKNNAADDEQNGLCKPDERHNQRGHTNPHCRAFDFRTNKRIVKLGWAYFFAKAVVHLHLRFFTRPARLVWRRCRDVIHLD